jgi:RimJ/RimL family protein N-acetyltransferase
MNLGKTLKIVCMTETQSIDKKTSPLNEWVNLFNPKWVDFSERPIGVLGVAINTLGKLHKSKIKKHLLSLDNQDRFMRFGYTATDEHIERYVDGLNYERDDIYGIFSDSMELVAMAHLALPNENDKEKQAEFGVSVLKTQRGKGYGNKLFERASIHATNNNIKTIFIHALSENAHMLKIARKHGAVLNREGSETEAYVSLAKPSIDTQLNELMLEQYAKTNYDIRREIKKFWDFMKDVQEIRQGVKLARQKSAS